MTQWLELVSVVALAVVGWRLAARAADAHEPAPEPSARARADALGRALDARLDELEKRSA